MTTVETCDRTGSVTGRPVYMLVVGLVFVAEAEGHEEVDMMASVAAMLACAASFLKKEKSHSDMLRAEA